MTAEKLEETLREFKYRKPFEPFVLELVDGKTVFVDDGGALGFGEGVVLFFSADNQFVELAYGAVSNVCLAASEASR